MKKEVITITVPPEMKRELEDIAEKEHRSLAGQCTFFLSDSVKQYPTSSRVAEPSRDK